MSKNYPYHYQNENNPKYTITNGNFYLDHSWHSLCPRTTHTIIKMKITQSRPSQMITFTMTIHGIVYVQELPIPFTYSCQLDFIHIFEEIHINTRVANAQPWKIGLNKLHESTNKLWYKQTIKPNITDISYGIYFVSTMDWIMINYWQHTVYVQEFIKSSHFERHQCSIFYKIFFIFCTILWMNKTCA